MIPPVESSARISVLSGIFAESAEKGYVDFLETLTEIDAFGDVEYDEKLQYIKHLNDVAGMQAIVFSAMSFESAIYDFAAIHLGGSYVRNHLDGLDVVSKWLVVLRFITGIELPKGEAPYCAFKSLITDRNRLVHYKSEPFDFINKERQMNKILKSEEKHTKSVHNSFRAMVLMSLYLEVILDGYHNPLPSYDRRNAPMRRYFPYLKSVIEDCRNLILTTTAAKNL